MDDRLMVIGLELKLLTSISDIHQQYCKDPCPKAAIPIASQNLNRFRTHLSKQLHHSYVGEELI